MQIGSLPCQGACNVGVMTNKVALEMVDNEMTLTSDFDIPKDKNFKDETNINKVEAKVKVIIDEFLSEQKG